jgi:hypothetical protein
MKSSYLLCPLLLLFLTQNKNYRKMLVSMMNFLIPGFYKKTWPEGVKRPQRYCEIEEDLLAQAKKTPEPLSHPYTRVM